MNVKEAFEFWFSQNPLYSLRDYDVQKDEYWDDFVQTSWVAFRAGWWSREENKLELSVGKASQSFSIKGRTVTKQEFNDFCDSIGLSRVE